MKVLADATLPNIITAFPPPFELTLYKQHDEIPKLLPSQEILVCRSTLKVTKELLQGYSLRYVATASSGIDHIDESHLQANAIQLIDAKGSNASAVADYVIASLAFLQKYKNFQGKKAAVIGVGAVGSKVVEQLTAVNMEVIGYDPLRSQYDANFHGSPIETIIDCDLLCVHANLHDRLPYPSRNLFNEELIRQLKPGTAIINASRGGIVNESALLQRKEKLIYCTDVFSNEPFISKAIVDLATLCTPHIAGHSLEAKYAAVSHISQVLHTNYNLSLPKTIVPTTKLSALMTNQGWQEWVLSLYNPFKETQSLKKAQDLGATFQTLREAHNHRHDFRCIVNVID